MGSADKAAGA